MKSYSILSITFLCIILSGCSKKTEKPSSPVESDFLSYSIEGKDPQVSISPIPHMINITFPDSVYDAKNLIADFTLSSNCSATISSVKQVSGVSKNDYNKTFYYTITAADGASSDWSVVSTNNSYTADWGLGNFLEKNRSNDRKYSWYIDQINTGFDSVDNCGPSAVTMACVWADSTFSKTPQDARIAYRPGGGWWYTTDIDMYLHDNNVTHTTISLGSDPESTAAILEKQMNANQLVILCVDMDKIRFTNSSSYHTDKFYVTTPEFGHFLVVKGYKVVSDEIFFDAYDPNSWGQRNADGTLKGQDRYYRYEDIFSASDSWWPYAFAIAKKGSVLTYRVQQPKKIPVKYGR